MSDLLRQFSHKIKRIRSQRGLTQEGLALICNLDRTYIGRLERMERSPSLGTLADGLGISLSELLDF
ncbi:TPA: helix-turn-helix transcriptional regulator [Candidatus Scatousia excrementigallinarum]|uniref:Helix-turn-helix transcriptional regulator n=1 Tax=Candidatus Scatousia excrementigallinarum TaxID=2840935 RepID=A0A9D1F022_9BACT|nr:helix-turn-helix transcriptional regulator [Candidatus Scatousia excrementigallinarum]